MFAQSNQFETSVLGPFPALLLILILILSALGIVAHVAFA
jgi:hypothetical protein